MSKVIAYGLASLVSVSRVKGQQHFPSDVLIGSVLGEGRQRVEDAGSAAVARRARSRSAGGRGRAARAFPPGG